MTNLKLKLVAILSPDCLVMFEVKPGTGRYHLRLDTEKRVFAYYNEYRL